ncbi:MAG: ornithine cyclodeaminase family protein [Rhodospirillales bacterium]|nr:ornithine cyclodeaminase family protein [Rhodospirillales bacterium]
MAHEGTFLYLSQADVAAAGVPMARIVDAVELSLKEKALGRTKMPPKHWIDLDEHRFFSAMSSAVQASGGAVCKWQSGFSANGARGLPYITGLLIFSDIETGQPLALMDSTWITAQRTAAATAVAARHLAAPESRVLAMLGCGLQGRTHVVALRHLFPTFTTVRAFDLVAANAERYASEMERRHGIQVTCCPDAKTALEGADIIVSSGPIEPNAPRALRLDGVKPGALIVTIDYDSYWHPSALAAADGFYTDDVGQMLHLKEYGYFLHVPPVTAEIGEVVAGLKPGRRRPGDILMSMNMGVSVEDVATARLVYDAARGQGRGVRLPL